MQAISAFVILIAITLLIIGLIGAIKSVKRKERRVDKRAGVLLGVGFLLIIVGMVAMPSEEQAEVTKESNPETDKEVDAEEITDEQRVINVIKDAIPEKRIDDVNVREGFIGIKAIAADNLTTKLARSGMLLEATDVLERLKDANYNGDVSIMFSAEATNKHGEEFTMKVMSVDITAETLDRINFDNFNRGDLPDVADNYFEHHSIKP